MSKGNASSDAFTSSFKNPTTHPIYQLYLFCNVGKMSGMAISPGCESGTLVYAMVRKEPLWKP
jgi:hypothetical protein